MISMFVVRSPSLSGVVAKVHFLHHESLGNSKVLFWETGKLDFANVAGNS